jgi:integrase/recombinase XerD
MYTLKEALVDFIFHCRHEKGLSEKTINFYTIDLTQFTQFIKLLKSIDEVQAIQKEDLRLYIQEMSQLKPRTIKRKLATLKSFFNNLEYEDKITINPFRKMKIKIKEPRALPKALNKNEVKEIFREVYSSNNSAKKKSEFSVFSNARNVAVFELLFATGIRVSELSDLKVEHVNLKLGYIKVNGKGNKERLIQICTHEVLLALNSYMNLLLTKFQQPKEYFFLNRLGKKLSDQSIRSVVKKFSKQAKINVNVTPHVFRHTFATLMLENDVDIKYIQSFLGHSSIATTQIYTHVSRSKQRKIVQLKHPRKDFSMRE